MPTTAVVTVIDVPSWLDVLTVVVAALGGALFASRRRVTITGVLLVAVSVGLGGGMIRDVLLDVGAPKALIDLGLPASSSGCRGVRHAARQVVESHCSADAAAGLSGARPLRGGRSGTHPGLLDYPPASAVLIGVIAAIAGGIIRDLFVGDAPAIMQEGPGDASAALAGSVLMVALIAGFGLPTRVVEWPIILIIGGLSVLSVRLGWRAPMAETLAPMLGRPVAAVRRATRPREAREGTSVVEGRA